MPVHQGVATHTDIATNRDWVSSGNIRRLTYYFELEDGTKFGVIKEIIRPGVLQVSSTYIYPNGSRWDVEGDFDIRTLIDGTRTWREIEELLILAPTAQYHSYLEETAQ